MQITCLRQALYRIISECQNHINHIWYPYVYFYFTDNYFTLSITTKQLFLNYSNFIYTLNFKYIQYKFQSLKFSIIFILH